MVGQTKSFPKMEADKEVHVVVELQRVFKGKATGIGWCTLNAFALSSGGRPVLNEGKHACPLFKPPIGNPGFQLSDLAGSEASYCFVGDAWCAVP